MHLASKHKITLLKHDAADAEVESAITHEINSKAACSLKPTSLDKFVISSNDNSPAATIARAY